MSVLPQSIVCLFRASKWRVIGQWDDCTWLHQRDISVSKAGTRQLLTLLKGQGSSLVNQSLTNPQKKEEEDQNADDGTE